MMCMQMRRSPLMLAAQDGQLSVMKLLIAEKAYLHYQAIVSHILNHCDQLRTTIALIYCVHVHISFIVHAVGWQHSTPLGCCWRSHSLCPTSHSEGS